MFKKLFTYTILGFLQLSIGFVGAHAEEIDESLTPAIVFKNKTEIGEVKAIEKKLIKKVEKSIKDEVEVVVKDVGDIKKDINDEDITKELENDKKLEKELEDEKLKKKKKTKKVKKKPSISEYYSKHKTLMYKEENLVRMMQILTSLKQGIRFEKPIVGGELTSSEQEEILDDTIISVYLNSILYISDDLWSVWANGEKIIKYNDKNSEIRVLSVKSGKVKFLWTISRIKWGIINSNNTISKDVYTIKNERVNMIFTLEPNQSFVPSLNKVVEGNIEKDEKNGSPVNGLNGKKNTGKDAMQGLKDSDLDLFF